MLVAPVPDSRWGCSIDEILESGKISPGEGLPGSLSPYESFG